MNKKSNTYIYIIALGALIVAGIITTSIIGAIKNNQGAADIRAKAGTLNTLKLVGTVSEVRETDGTIIINDVQFSDESRSGGPVNYGTWTVTPPPTFNLFSATPGARITFTVSTTSFDVASKKVSAVQVTILP